MKGLTFFPTKFDTLPCSTFFLARAFFYYRKKCNEAFIMCVPERELLMRLNDFLFCWLTSSVSILDFHGSFFVA